MDSSSQGKRNPAQPPTGFDAKPRFQILGLPLPQLELSSSSSALPIPAGDS